MTCLLFTAFYPTKNLHPTTHPGKVLSFETASSSSLTSKLSLVRSQQTTGHWWLPAKSMNFLALAFFLAAAYCRQKHRGGLVVARRSWMRIFWFIRFC